MGTETSSGGRQYSSVVYAPRIRRVDLDSAPLVEKIKKGWHEPKQVHAEYPFPDITIARRFDRSRKGADWRRFEGALDTQCKNIGVTALSTSELQLVLIPPDMIGAALTDKYRKAARDERPNPRAKVANETSQTVNALLGDLGAQYRHTYQDLTHGPTYDLPARAAGRLMGMTLLERDDADYAVQANKKGEQLWQSHVGTIDEFEATGSHSYGVRINDDAGVYASEAQQIARALCDRLDLNPTHFARLANMSAEVTMVLTAPRQLRNLGEIEIPPCPIDMPFSAPRATVSH
ncbi:MAG: hypothetical protein ABI602_04060 [Candidatus Saccharibacteria bacterium]